MNKQLYLSSSAFNELKPIHKTFNCCGLDFDLYESPYFPYEETVPASDVETKELIRVKTGREIIGVLLDNNDFINKYINPNREILLIDNV